MKPAAWRPQARQDRRAQVDYYRTEAGPKTAERLIDNLRQELRSLQRQPGMGSPVLGKVLGVDGLRSWLVSGFPLVLLYIERPALLDVVRLLGQQQDIAGLLDDADNP